MAISRTSSVIIVSVIIVVSIGSILILTLADVEEITGVDKTEENDEGYNEGYREEERPDDTETIKGGGNTDNTKKLEEIVYCSVRYYNGASMIHETTVGSGSKTTTIDFTGNINPLKKFLGWSTDPSGTERIYPSGHSLTVYNDISLYAVISDNIETFYIVTLPEEEEQLSMGYKITADSVLIPEGGKCTLTYTLLIGYADDDLRITVNGSSVGRDGANKVHISNVKENLLVEVSGIRNTRSYSISVPEEQIGYSLTVTSDNVNHGGWYEITYSLKPHFTEVPGNFKVSIKGGKTLSFYQGRATVSDVTSNHTIVVEGVEPTNYKITAGKNTKLMINGVQAQTARFDDVITPVSNSGYEIPLNYGTCVPNTVTINGGGYSVSGDSVFPSVVKIEMGDNISITGQSKKSFFACTNDVLTISYPGGLPSSYKPTILNLPGVSSKGTGFCFDNDTKLPGIYTITYQGQTTIYEVFHETEGQRIPVPGKNPERPGCDFSKWNTDETIVKNNINIPALWSLHSFEVKFGSNISYSIDGVPHIEPNSFILTVENEIKIKGALGYVLPDGYIPISVIEKNGGYYATTATEFRTIYLVEYRDLDSGKNYRYYLAENGFHFIINPAIQQNPLFELNFDVEGHSKDMFIGWTNGVETYTSGSIRINSNLILFPKWKNT